MAALRSMSKHFDPDQRLNPGVLLEEVASVKDATVKEDVAG